MSNASEIRYQISRKYDTNMEKYVLDWIAGVLEEPDIFSNISGPSEVQKYLKNGTILCKLMNKIKPASIKHFDHNPRTPFQKMENISLFNEAIRLYGVQSEYVFVTNDLFEKKNMVQVLIGLRALGTIATANGVKPAIAI